MSTLTGYWQSEADRIQQTLTEARARMATLRQDGQVARQALRAVQDQALTAANAQDTLRAALARIAMPADAKPLLNALNAARVSQAQAQSEQLRLEGLLAEWAVETDGLSQRMQALEAEAEVVARAWRQAQAEAAARAGFVAELQAGRWQDAVADATAALAAHEATARERVEGAFPASDATKPLLLQRLRDRAEAARDAHAQAELVEQATYAPAHPALAQAQRAHARAWAAVQAYADAAAHVADDTAALAALAALPTPLGPLTAAQADRLRFEGNAPRLARAEAMLALLKDVDDAEDTLRAKQAAYEQAWAAARAAKPDATLAALHAADLKAPLKARDDALKARKEAHKALTEHADHGLLQAWLADVPDTLWDALDRLDGARARLNRLKSGTALSQLLSALTLAESQHADALQAARLAQRQQAAAQQAWAILAARAEAEQARLLRRARLAWRGTAPVV